ncbi:hypothetical protein IAU60_002573 [Kwoniella sp. DSM 27419]
MDFDKDVARPPPARRRSRPSVWRCLAATCGLFVLGIIVFVGYIAWHTAREMVNNARNPHKVLLYNGTLSPDLTAAQVVRPFIDQDTRFDVYLSVHARLPNEETAHADELAKEQDWDPEDYTGAELAIGASTGHSPVEVRHPPQEQLIYEGIIMKDMSLGHRDVERVVHFDLPLKRFRDHFLYAADVRGAIALIPRINSKLDRLEDFSDWRPDIPGMVLERLSPEAMQDYSQKEWEALEAIAYSFTMIEFHHKPSTCNDTQTAKDPAVVDDDDLYSSIMIEDEKKAAMDADESAADINNDDDGRRVEIKAGDMTDKPKMGNVINKDLHPYLVARHHVYIINETRLFDRKAYDIQHKETKKHACGLSSPGGNAHRFRCHRSYQHTGQWGTRFVLGPDTREGKPQGKELAYGPFISNLNHGAGPKDVHAIPVDRHNCTNSSVVADPETMRVNYTIRFSSLTPARVSLLDNFVNQHRVPHNATELDKAELHNMWEQNSGVWGSKGHGTRPFTRLVIVITRDLVLGLPVALLTLLYWHTRVTVQGINIVGTTLFALSHFAETTVEQWGVWHGVDEVGTGILMALWAAFEYAPGVLQLKTVLPVEIERTGWKLGIRRVHWTHKERASMRKGTGYDWRFWTTVFAAFFAAVYLPGKSGYQLVKAHLPPNPSDATRKMPSVLRWLMNRSNQSLRISTAMLGELMQIAHNHANGTFAGQYAIAAYMMLAYKVLQLVYYFPSVVGRFEVHEALPWYSLLEVGLLAAHAWQAWTLPRVEQKVDDAEEE